MDNLKFEILILELKLLFNDLIYWIIFLLMVILIIAKVDVWAVACILFVLGLNILYYIVTKWELKELRKQERENNEHI